MPFADDNEFDDEALILTKQIQDGVDDFRIDRPTIIPVSEDQLSDKIIQDASELIHQGLEAVAMLKGRAASGADPEAVAAFAGLISSTTGAIEALSKINAVNQKSKAARSLECLRNEHKLQQIEQKNKTLIADETNPILASREDIINMLLRPKRDDKLPQAVIINDDSQSTNDKE